MSAFYNPDYICCKHPLAKTVNSSEWITLSSRFATYLLSGQSMIHHIIHLYHPCQVNISNPLLNHHNPLYTVSPSLYINLKNSTLIKPINFILNCITITKPQYLILNCVNLTESPYIILNCIILTMYIILIFWSIYIK